MSPGSQPPALNQSSADDLKRRIARFMADASTEITPADQKLLPELARSLAPGTSVYVAHPPAANLSDVVRAALAVHQAGFIAFPHVVARRIPNALTLRRALAELQAGGVQQVMLVAGDSNTPMGEFSSTLDLLESGALEQSGIKCIGVAAHPDGHQRIGPTLLWEALQAKQAFASRAAIRMHIVTQFSFDAEPIIAWEQQLGHHGIQLPVHAGIAGPAPLRKLIHYAMQCGIGASLRTAVRNLSAIGSFSDLAIQPEQHLIRLIMNAPGSRIVAPHIFSFGGCVATAQWISRVATGDIEIGSNVATRSPWM